MMPLIDEEGFKRVCENMGGTPNKNIVRDDYGNVERVEYTCYIRPYKREGRMTELTDVLEYDLKGHTGFIIYAYDGGITVMAANESGMMSVSTYDELKGEHSDTPPNCRVYGDSYDREFMRCTVRKRDGIEEAVDIGIYGNSVLHSYEWENKSRVLGFIKLK